LSPRRTLVEGADVQIAIDGESQGSGDRCGAHEQDVGRFTFCGNRSALLDTESVLLVDGDEAKSAKDGSVLDEGVGSDDEYWIRG